jgi:hypothetical protein
VAFVLCACARRNKKGCKQSKFQRFAHRFAMEMAENLEGKVPGREDPEVQAGNGEMLDVLQNFSWKKKGEESFGTAVL